ncbi:O-antigen ligase family protein [Novosphingobium jiangmenense]|uniref:O-antigen ligase family protein n=1 Tax=Novosphingobium jiangmenense TaxID=2791981 RepID=A0ABS0HBR6_9SPHN|nr:O-antigen ligase family protein [Novosphingobium jiangmenense]MBF9149667.1 O-antigen ligase family protein [Novosphingobium jiangmenense]
MSRSAQRQTPDLAEFRALGWLMLLAPMFFGGNRPFFWHAIALMTAMLCLAMFRKISRREVRHIDYAWQLQPALFGGIIVTGWIIATIIPGMPGGNALWAKASASLGTPLYGTISLYPAGTLEALVRLASYLGVYWLALHFSRQADRALVLLRWIGLSGAALSLYGIVNFSLGNRDLLFQARYGGFGDVTGTFVNRNHFATYAGLCALANAALAFIGFRKRWGDVAYLPSSFVRALSAFAGNPAAYFLASSICVMGLFQSHSRMGMVSFVIALLVAVSLMAAVGYFRADRRLAAVVIGLLFFYLYVSGLTTLDRFSGSEDTERWPLFQICLDAIARLPWTGHGYGTFAHTFEAYRTGDFAIGTNVTEAHNVYLELAFELGIPATILAVGAVAWLVCFCVFGAFRRKRERIFPVLAVSASVLVGLHSLADFSVQMPGIAVIYAALLGVGCAQAWSHRSGTAE